MLCLCAAKNDSSQWRLNWTYRLEVERDWMNGRSIENNKKTKFKFWRPQKVVMSVRVRATWKQKWNFSSNILKRIIYLLYFLSSYMFSCTDMPCITVDFMPGLYTYINCHPLSAGSIWSRMQICSQICHLYLGVISYCSLLILSGIEWRV